MVSIARLKEACSHCLPPTVAPYHAVCTPPALVTRVFEQATIGRDVRVIGPADLAKFMTDWQGDRNATEERATSLMADFNFLKSTASRALRIPGLSHSSKYSLSSRHSGSKHGQSAPETPTFDIATFLKFLLHP